MAEKLYYFRPNAIDPVASSDLIRLVWMTAAGWGCLLGVLAMSFATRDQAEPGMWVTCLIALFSPCSLVFAVLGVVHGLEFRRDHASVRRWSVLICIGLDAIIAVGLPAIWLLGMFWIMLG